LWPYIPAPKINTESENTTNRGNLRPRAAKLEDYLRLLDNGSLRRNPHPAGVIVSSAEKAL